MTRYRQLAAIMFTDIAGYTAIMGADEPKALQLLERNRQLQKPLVRQYDGRWIKELGDGTLLSFHGVSDAVECAIQIQKAVTELGDYQLRIGIHIGDVTFEHNDVFGDGVNIAARMQSAAPVGGIWVSGAAYRAIPNQAGISSRLIGAMEFKHVKDAVEVYEIDAAASVTAPRTSIPAYVNSIAVLPFTNGSKDPDQEYLCDGIAEEIINLLAPVRKLKVAGRTSSFRFRQADTDLNEIGDKLGVETILEGSVRRQGDKLRVNAALINVSDGLQLWSGRYDRSFDDVFSIQDDIAEAIAEKLKVTLLKRPFDQTYVPAAEVYELYLKARFFTNRRGPHLMTGIQYYKQAMERDPNYALPYSGFADAMLLLAAYGFAPAGQVMPPAKAAALKAVSLDPELAEAYAALGFYYAGFEHDWPSAKEHYRRSLELNPRHAEGHYRYGWNYLAWVEASFQEAERHCRQAVQLEPLNPVCYAPYAFVLQAAGKYEQALETALAGVELDNSSFICLMCAGKCCTGLGDHARAIDYLSRAAAMSNRHSFPVAMLSMVFSRGNQPAEALALLDELEQRMTSGYVSQLFLGLAHAWYGNEERAKELFEASLAEREPMLLALKHEPLWAPDALKQSAWMQDFLLRIGIPEKAPRTTVI